MTDTQEGIQGPTREGLRTAACIMIDRVIEAEVAGDHTTALEMWKVSERVFRAYFPRVIVDAALRGSYLGLQFENTRMDDL